MEQENKDLLEYLYDILSYKEPKWIGQGNVSCDHPRLVEWRKARQEAVMREKIEAELREKEYKDCLKRYEDWKR